MARFLRGYKDPPGDGALPKEAAHFIHPSIHPSIHSFVQQILN